MRAAAECGGSGLLQFSQVGRSSSISIPSGDELLDLSVEAEAQPGFELGLELPVARDREPPLLLGARDRGVAHPDFRHGAQIGRQKEIDLEAGVDRAQVYLLAG